MFKCYAGVEYRENRAWNLEKTHGSVRLKKRCIRTSTVHSLSRVLAQRSRLREHLEPINCLPGYLLFVSFLTNNVFDVFYPVINVTLIDHDRSGNNVIQRAYFHLFVEIKHFHREITLEPKSLHTHPIGLSVKAQKKVVGMVL